MLTHSSADSGFSSCAEGRTVSVSWSCRQQFKEMQECMKPQFVLFTPFFSLSSRCFDDSCRIPTSFNPYSMSEEKIDAAKVRWFREGGQIPLKEEKKVNNSPYA
jgi:hypothetical protein